MAGRRITGRGHEAVVVRSGVRWQLDLREGIDFSIFLLGLFEPETARCYRRLIRPGDVVLDIGANIGAHTLHLAAAVGPGGRVIAFEPTAYAFAKLRTNVELNPELREQIELLQAFLTDAGARNIPGNIYSSWPLESGAGRHAGHLGRLERTSGANVMILDQVAAERNLTAVNFIKLDVDGFECAVLRGAQKILSKYRPTVLLELSPYVLREHGSSIDELVDIFSNAGYRFFAQDGRTPISMDPAALQRLIPDGSSRNAIALPAGAH